MIKQLSVFIENKPGRLRDVSAVIAAADINLHALSLADTTDFGILRLIVSNADYAKSVLKDAGFMVKITDVAAVSLPHKPGSLSAVLTEMDKAGVSIEYMYAFTSQSEKHGAVVVFSLSQRDAEANIENVKFLQQDAIDEL